MAAQSLVMAGTSTPQVVAGSTPSGGAHGYIRVRLKPVTGSLYLGDSGVTTAGYPLSSGDAPIEVNLVAGETLWFATSSGASASLGILRVNETT